MHNRYTYSWPGSSACKCCHVTKENFETEVLQSEKKVLIDFWASWCGPCRMVYPIIDEIAGEQDAVKICKVNVDEQPGTARRSAS